MSETQTQDAPQTRQPGRYEAEALVRMNEIERPSYRPRRHVVVHREEAGTYASHEWNPATARWDRKGLFAGAIRVHALDFLVPLVAFANVAITDRCIDYDELKGIGLADFDECAFYEHRNVFCPEGTPGMADEWAVVTLGLGKPCIAAPCRFPNVSLADRFQRVAAQQPGLHEAPTVLVRHDVAARDLVPKERWGIDGRPDVLGRQVDDELRRRQEQEEETQRLLKQPGGFDAFRRQQQAERQKQIDRMGKGR